MCEVYLTAMQGLTDAPFRLICAEMGCDGAVTEMVETGTYAHTRKKRAQIEQGLTRLPGEKRLSVQLIGKEPEEMALCAERVSEMNCFDALEVNMGCPARKVVTGGSGSALMNDMERAQAILRAVRLHTDLPLHLKIRLGWDDAHRNAAEIARMAEQEGVCRLTVHGRTRAQFYGGDADCAGIAEVARAVHIPVMANGGVRRAQDADAFASACGTQAVGIGRAALMTPWIFDDIRRLRQGQAIPTRDVAERAALLLRHARLECALNEEAIAIKRMRKIALWYLNGLTGFRELCERINHVERLEDFCAEVVDYRERLSAAGDVRPHAELCAEEPRLSLPGR